VSLLNRTARQARALRVEGPGAGEIKFDQSDVVQSRANLVLPFGDQRDWHFLVAYTDQAGERQKLAMLWDHQAKRLTSLLVPRDVTPA
jgi:hypothetical protein